MSRHIYYTTTAEGDGIAVVVGYAGGEERFYLSVERWPRGPREKEDPFLYSILEDERLCGGAGAELGYFRARLKELGIVVPESLFKEAQKDADRQEVHRHVIHASDGTMREIRHKSARSAR